MKYDKLNRNGWIIALIFIILSGLFIQWSYMNEFPSFIHAWSQTDRYAIALGFVNNDLDFLRYKVTKIGYYIASEKMVKDASIIYTIIEFRKGYKFYSKKQLFFGPCLLKENNDLFKEKCRVDLGKMENFYPLIPKNHWHHRYKTFWKIKAIKKILSK